MDSPAPISSEDTTYQSVPIPRLLFVEVDSILQERAT